MNNILTTFCLCLLSFVSSAQYDHLLNDPNVIWAAETTLDFIPEPEYATPDSVEQYLRYSIPLKLVNNEKKPSSEWGIMLNPRLQSLVFERMAKGGCFATPDANLPLSEEACINRLRLKDTITTYDPETYLPQTQIVYNCDPFYLLYRIRARQLLYFDQKEGDFKIFTAAIAPVLVRSFDNTPVPYVPFWIKPDNKAKTKISIADPDVTWARRMFPLNPPDPATLKPLKDFKPPVLQQFLDRAQHDSYDIWYTGYEDALIGADAKKNIFSTSDTVITFDPETYEEVIKHIQYELKAADIVHLKLAQDWYWNERRQQLYIRLYAYAPVKANKDTDGNFRFYQPLFWRKIKNKR